MNKKENIPAEKIKAEESTLDLGIQTVRTLGYRIIDMIADELSHPHQRPSFPPPPQLDHLESLFGGPVPRHGADPSELLTTIQKQFLDLIPNTLHDKVMGYVISTPVTLSGLIGALANSLNFPSVSWVTTPGTAFIEATVVRWFGEMLGFSSTAAGYLTSGGSWANLMGLAIGRVRKAGWDVRKEGSLGSTGSSGSSGNQRLVAYASQESHSCLDKSIELLGMGSDNLRKIAVDGEYRIRLDLLENAIRQDLASGYKPFCVIGNAGTVNTGAVDPLGSLADIASRYDLWFHVDGAYGAFAAMVAEMRHLFTGIDRIDSLVLDPHKWLNIPIGCGCILVRNWEDLSSTFSVVPSYLYAAVGREHNFFNYGFELTRADNSLKIWIALRHYGIDRYVELIKNHITLARFAAAVVEESDDLELVAEPVLSICCFRFVPKDLDGRDAVNRGYLNRLNQEIEAELIRDGTAMISSTELQGLTVLRMCIVSHRVTKRSVSETLSLIRKIGQDLDKKMRS